MITLPQTVFLAVAGGALFFSINTLRASKAKDFTSVIAFFVFLVCLYIAALLSILPEGVG